MIGLVHIDQVDSGVVERVAISVMAHHSPGGHSDKSVHADPSLVTLFSQERARVPTFSSTGWKPGEDLEK